MNETVLITGANRGLGYSLAERFLGGGFQVFAGYRKSLGELERLAQVHPLRLVPVQLDVTDLESVRQAAHRVTGQAPALDVLINNAAIFKELPKKQLEEQNLTDGRLEETMNVNAFGALRVTQQFLPLLEKGTRKLIANISSEAGSIADCQRTDEYAYPMSKAALNMASRIMQNAFCGRGFRVLVIQPGWMRTDMGGADADLHPDEFAVGIFQLVMKAWLPGDPMYMDHDGNLLPW